MTKKSVTKSQKLGQSLPSPTRVVAVQKLFLIPRIVNLRARRSGQKN
jgi:hypothetical protein